MAEQTIRLVAASQVPGPRAHTFQMLQQACSDATGKSTLANVNFTYGSIVNDGLELFCTLHPWTFLERALSLDLAVDVAYSELPTDFRELVSLHRANDLTDVRVVDLDELVKLRTRSDGSLYAMTPLAAFAWTTPAAPTDLPRARLEWYPTPPALATAAYIGVYRRQLPQLIDLADYPAVPVQFHQLLRKVCEAQALTRLEDEKAADWWADVQAWLPSFTSLDGRAAGSLGPIQGAASRGRLLRWTPDIQVIP